MTIGYLFAGQGQQFLHMGQDLVASYPQAAEIYQTAARVLGYDVLNLDEDQLNQTQYTQVAMYVLNHTIQTLLSLKGIEASVALGLSLGEYNALTYAKSLDFEEGLHLVSKRAKIMSEALVPGTSGMAACLKTDRETVSKALEGTEIAICNVNTPTQIVIGGDKLALDRLIPNLKEAGIRMVIPLKMSTASHMHLLSEASQELKTVLETVDFKTPQCTFINNIHADIQTEGFVDTLSRHICEKTELASSIERMAQEGVSHFVEIGPKGSLAKFVKEIVGKDTKVSTVYNLETLEGIEL